MSGIIVKANGSHVSAEFSWLSLAAFFRVSWLNVVILTH